MKKLLIFSFLTFFMATTITQATTLDDIKDGFKKSYNTDPRIHAINFVGALGCAGGIFTIKHGLSRMFVHPSNSAMRVLKNKFGGSLLLALGVGITQLGIYTISDNKVILQDLTKKTI